MTASLVIFATSAFATTEAGISTVIKNILRDRCLNQSDTAVMVMEAATGKVLFNKNGEKPLTPASVMKLVTTAASLRYLGPDYRFKTKIFYTGQRRGGKIMGDLIIRGGGDPQLTPESLWLIVQDIKRRGITEIRGGLFLDESFFDKLRRAPGLRSFRTQNPYDAMLGALSVNFNTVAVHIYPGLAPGDPLIVGLVPETDYFTVNNNGETKATGKRTVSAMRVNGKGKVKVNITGRMRLSDRGKIIYLNIDDPLRYAREAFLAYLKRAGIKINGIGGVKPTPGNAKLLYMYQSVPLSVILRGLNRYSNNFVAEQIAKTMAAEVSSSPGTHKKALSLNLSFLNKAGVDTSGIVLADGSGLSRKNRLTVKAVAQLLSVMSRKYDIGPDFTASLGIMGVDGSVETRLKVSPARSFSRAKTGSLNGISSLAGYVQAKNGKLYAFAIILTGSKCHYKTADAMEDKIVTAVYLLGDN